MGILKKGDQGKRVTDLQKLLVQRGYPLDPSGVFDMCKAAWKSCWDAAMCRIEIRFKRSRNTGEMSR